jgi:hypothetical protein
MNIELKDVLSLLGSISIGAILLDWLRIRFEKRKKENEKRHELKEVRYKPIVLLMLASFDFEKNKVELHKHGRINLINLKDLYDELETEWKHMILFADDKVFKSMGEFVRDPTWEIFWQTALEMRRDLYGIQTKLSLEDFIEKSTKK